MLWLSFLIVWHKCVRKFVVVDYLGWLIAPSPQSEVFSRPSAQSVTT